MRFRLEIVQNIKPFNGVFKTGVRSRGLAGSWALTVQSSYCFIGVDVRFMFFHVHLLLSRIDKLDYYNKINPSRNKTNDDAI